MLFVLLMIGFRIHDGRELRRLPQPTLSLS